MDKEDTLLALNYDPFHHQYGTFAMWFSVHCSFDLANPSIIFFGSRVNKEENSFHHALAHKFLEVASVFFIHKMD